MSIQKQLLTVVLCVLTLTSFGQGDTLRVLFLGNSYTAANNLPQLVTDVAASAGDAVIQSNNTPGGYTFQLHSTNTQSVSQIQQGGWDYLVLQEQSQLPSFPIQQVEVECFPYAKYLDSIFNVYNPCGETVFYRTWGRKNGDVDNCPNWPPVCTYSGMDSLLNLRYRMMADNNQAVLSPVGNVWKYLRANNPGIELYVSDNSHPSEAGSYAAACCMYTVLYKKNPQQITYNFNLTANDALMIRNAVKTVVFDSLTYWNAGIYNPSASFTSWIENSLTVHFNNTSNYSTDYSWDFGDGTGSNIPDPVHIYVNAGDYTVKLISEKCGISDTYIMNIHLEPVGIQSTELQDITVFPNPFIDQILIKSSLLVFPGSYIEIVDNQGRLICHTPSGGKPEQKLSIQTLKAGVYFLKIVNPEGTVRTKLVKRPVNE
jgi:PKD repeat protein